MNEGSSFLTSKVVGSVLVIILNNEISSLITVDFLKLNFELGSILSLFWEIDKILVKTSKTAVKPNFFSTCMMSEFFGLLQIYNIKTFLRSLWQLYCR